MTRIIQIPQKPMKYVRIDKKQTMAVAAPVAAPQEPQEPSLDDGERCAVAFGFIVVGLAIYGAVHLFLDVCRISGQKKHDPLQYNVTITAVIGLDPAKDLHAGGLLHPAFNLTLLAASPRKAGCVEPGTTVEVSYLRSGVPLATGPAPTFCVDGRERREEASIVAWGDGVRLPELLVDSLIRDMLRGVPEFGVKLIPVPQCDCDGEAFCHDTIDVISCWAKVGGGPAPCSASKERVSCPPVPVPRPGVARDSAMNLPQPSTP